MVFKHPWHRQTGSKVFVEIMVMLVIATVAGTWVWKNLPEHIPDSTSIIVLPFQNQDSNIDLCADDLACILEHLPPPLKGFADRFREIYRKPANEAEAEVAFTAARVLLEEVPDLVNFYSGSACDFEHTKEL